MSPHNTDTTLPQRQWNGPYGALLFINAWEYTRDQAFAKSTTLPLLDGLNAWTRCYLSKNGTQLDDWNQYVPDQVFENRPAKNPGVGLAMMMRVATAQRDIAAAVGVPYPPYLDDIISHLAPLPQTDGPPNEREGGGTKVWAAADGISWTDSSIYRRFASVLYPIWPAETVDAFGSDATVGQLALASAVLYANLTCGDGYPEKPFATCVDAGWGALTIFSALARVLPATPGGGSGSAGSSPNGSGSASSSSAPATVTAKDLADAFETYIAAYSANSTNFLASNISLPPSPIPIFSASTSLLLCFSSSLCVFF